jgi:hypothetical protein
MSGTVNPQAFCGCCEAPVPAAPLPVVNRPGLSRINFRIGTFATLREAMLDQIHADPALSALTTRDSDDDTITVLELMAALGHVLSFYNERNANEIFVRTAQQRDSLLRLLRLIGYRLRPGLAATTLLSFAADPGGSVRIRRGLKVMSVPAQDQMPAIYESLEALSAHGDLNAAPVFSSPSPFNAFATGSGSAPVVARPSGLTVGNTMVFFGLGAVEEKTVAALDLRPGGEHLGFSAPIQQTGWWPGVTWAEQTTGRLRFFGYNATDTTIFVPAPTGVGGSWEKLVVDGSFPRGNDLYPLDSRHDDLRAGTRLLIDLGPGATPRLAVTVVSATADQPATLGTLTDSVTHVRLRQTINGRPSLIEFLGFLFLFVRSSEGVVLVNDTTPGAVPLPLDDFVAASEVVAVVSGPDRVDVFACNAATWLATNTWTGTSGWSGWTSLDGFITSNPAPILLDTGELLVFARGVDFGLWVHGILPTLFTWLPLGGPIASDPVPVSWGSGRIDVFVRGIDRGLWVNSRDGGTWSGFQPLLGTLGGTPAAASTGPGRLDVVALSDAGTLIARRFAGTDWSDWLDLGGSARDTPTIVVTGADRVDVFVRGTDNQLWQISRTGDTWSGWTALGGAIGGPLAVLVMAGTLTVCARSLDGSLTQTAWTAGVWQGWSFPAMGLPYIPDRRKARVWQLGDTPIVFRTYDYPMPIAGGRVAMRVTNPAQGGAALLAKGRRLLLQTDAVVVPATVTAVQPLAAVPGAAPDHVLIDISPPLPAPTAQCTLMGNVALASHGETQPDQILGNADGARNFQQFRLARAPVTHLPDPTEIAGVPALTVSVGGTPWKRVDSLYGQAPTARVFTARQADTGETTITFGGNGTGAVPQSGAVNVVASCRVGLSLAGQVSAGQLSVLLERPNGLSGVNNPLPASGAADPEPRDAARVAAPSSVKSFGRIVALSDFESVALASGLVATAQATWVWQSWQRAVFLTVAGQQGVPLSDGALGTLYGLLTAARDPNHVLTLANLVRIPLVVAARLLLVAGADPDVVSANALAALLAAFAFDTMPLAQSVHLSHVMAALQSTDGVLAVGMDVFQLRDWVALSAKERGVRAITLDPVQDHVRIFPARPTPSDTTLIDRYARAGFRGPPPPVLAAEQAAILSPATDVRLTVVEAL